jgi:cell wall-associated NlpC family hydrolase
VALALTVSALPAYADPSISSKRNEALRVKAQIDELDRQVEIAAEAYNEANAEHQQVLGRIKKTRATLDKTNARIDTLQTHLSVRTRSMYRSGPLSFLEVLFDSEDFEDFASNWDLLRDMNAQEAEDVASLKQARAEAEKVKAELDKQEAAAKKVVDQMSANKRSIESRLATRKAKLDGIESEIAAIESAEQARAAAAARAAVSRANSSARTFPPPTRAARSEVVSIAKRYLGAPYRWGASGPNSFDCSGFTMFVYSQVGVSLPHSSRAQIGSGQRVSMSDLQPGDLVFFGSPIHHVGIYVGGGSYIHAPHTGAVVRIDPLNRGDYAGACRP